MLALSVMACVIAIGAIFGADVFALALMNVFCLVCIGQAAYFACWWHRHLASSVKLNGRIVRPAASKHYTYPEVQFLAGGKTHSFISRHEARYKQGVGTSVVVAYSESTDRAEILSFATRWACILGPGPAGVFFLYPVLCETARVLLGY